MAGRSRTLSACPRRKQCPLLLAERLQPHSGRDGRRSGQQRAERRNNQAAEITSMAKKKAARKTETLLPKLTEAEQSILSHLQDGYQLETDSLGGSPILRRLKDNELLRPADATASTVRALQQRGLVQPVKGRDPLTIGWRLKKKGK
jgi:hypothetical protein